jgi:hypothetical protein
MDMSSPIRTHITEGQRLCNAIEFENEEELKEFHRNLVAGRILLRPQEIDEAFLSAVNTQEVTMVRWVLEELKLRPSPNLLSQCFDQLSRDGEYPEMLELLQQAVPPMVLAEAFRNLRYSDRYLVNVSEAVELKEFFHMIEKLTPKKTGSSSSSVARKTVIALELRCCSRFHDMLLDSVFSGRNWIVSKLLGEMYRYVPDESKLQSAVNDAFSEAVKRHSFVIANIIARRNRRGRLGGTLQVNQRGFDATFADSVDRMDIIAVTWLLSGQLGFAPAAETVESPYRDLALKLARESLGYQLNESGNLVPISYLRRSRHEYSDSLLTMTNILRARVGSEVMDKSNFEIETESKLIQLKIRKQRIRAQIMRGGGVADIHSFSGAAVQMDTVANFAADEGSAEGGGDDAAVAVDATDEPEPVPRTQGGRKSLNKRILQYLKSKINEAASLQAYPDLDSITRRFVQIIGDEFADPHKEDAALRVIVSVLHNSSLDMFRTTLHYLDSLPEEIRGQSVSLWISGFVSESITEHSCNAGMMERAITGLRGINDPELNRIFSQVEAPHLIRTFLTGVFNIYGKDSKARCAHIVNVLTDKGVTAASSEEEATVALVQYARDSIRGYDENVERYEEEVQVMVESVMDSYSTDIRPLLS